MDKDCVQPGPSIEGEPWQESLGKASELLLDFLQGEKFEILMRHEENGDYLQTQWIAQTRECGSIFRTKAFGVTPLAAAQSLVVALRDSRPEWKDKK